MCCAVEEQVEELLRIYPDTQQAVEANVTYFLIPQLPMPEGCTPATIDVLLCPTPRDGYNSRLYYSQQVLGGPERNWHVQNVRILDRNWFAFSLRTRDNLRLAQMVSAHLYALKK